MLHAIGLPRQEEVADETPAETAGGLSRTSGYRDATQIPVAQTPNAIIRLNMHLDLESLHSLLV